jgi:hypothetical protein
MVEHRRQVAHVDGLLAGFAVVEGLGLVGWVRKAVTEGRQIYSYYDDCNRRHVEHDSCPSERKFRHR